jgi:cytochrome P450
VTEACSASLFAGLGRPPDWNRFTSDFALPLPSHVVTNLLDIQDSAAPEICRWLDDLVRCFSPAATPLEVERGKIAAEQLLSALNATKGFVTDLTGDVCRAGFEGPYLAVANALGLLFQSYEGIAGLIGNAVIELSYRAQSAQKTHDDGRVLQSVVEHVVRNDSPVQNTRRFVAERVYALGKTFAQGDRVLLILAAANRDPKANGRVFTFGAGVHACPGGMIAMTIATKALECIVAQHTDLAPIAGTVSYRPSQNTRIPLFGLDTIR